MLDPTRRNIIIVGAAAAVLVVAVMAVVIIRGRAGLGEETPVGEVPAMTGGGTVGQTTQPPGTAGQPATTTGGEAGEAIVVPPGAAKGVTMKVEGKVEDTVDPRLIGTTQTFTPAELKAMGLSPDLIVHYKWVLPPEGANYSAPMRLILDMPEGEPQKDVVMPVKTAK